jgi:hypothetical protein
MSGSWAQKEWVNLAEGAEGILAEGLNEGVRRAVPHFKLLPAIFFITEEKHGKPFRVAG